MGFPNDSLGKEFACNIGGPGDMGSILGLGRPPGAGHGDPLQYSCLGNHRDMLQANNNPTFWMS